MWFDSWSDIARTLLVGGAAYIALMLVLRVSGKRTLSQLNAFDFVVTVALGSTLATVLLSSEVSWTEGVVALALLASLQFVIAWVTTRWQPLRKVITSSPQVLLRDGAVDPVALRKARLSEAEVRQAVRSSGAGDLADVAIVVLETNGSISVIGASRLGSGSALQDLE